METAIEALQDRIIYLTGQIVLIQKEDIPKISKKVVIKGWQKEIEEVVIKGWQKEIEELKKAQSILSNCL